MFGLRIDAKLPPEDGALVLRALEAARDALHAERAAEADESRDGSAGPLAAAGPSGSAEPPPVASPSNAESLAALAEAASATRSSCTSTPRPWPRTRRGRA